MRKILLLCAFLLLTGSTLVSQTILFTESFENGGSIPAGWSNTIMTSGSPVTFITSGSTGYPAVTVTPYNGTYEVFYNAYSISSGGSTLLARTANTSTVGYTNITVDFAMYHDNGYNPSTGEGIQPQYSIDNGTNWLNAGAFINRYSASNGWVIHTISLPANAAGIANLRIAFLFVSQFGNNVFLDFAHINGSAAALTLPFTEDWETAAIGQAPPANWGTEVVSGVNATYFQSAGTWPTCTPYSGSRMVEFQSFSYSNADNRLKLTTPITTVGYSTIALDFRWLTDPGYSTPPYDRVNVQYSTNGTLWTTVATFNRYDATQAWTFQSLTLPAGAGNQATLYIAFDFISVYGNNCHLDLVHVYAVTAPTVVTTAAIGVTSTGATLNGTVNANGASTAVTFNYGLTTTYGSTVPGVPTPVTGNTVTGVSANITGLLPGTLYHYQVSGVNSVGTSNGNDMTFTTLALAPTVVTTAATGVTTTTATLNGIVTANGSSTTTSFDWGLTTNYGNSAAATPSPVTGNSATNISANLTGLLANNTYHFRAKGVNGIGTTNGSDLTFFTVCPIAGPAGPITGPTQVCQGGSGYVYSVTIPNATGYVWTLPIGGTITAGANTNTITVSFAGNSAPGYMFVYGTAACGNGAPSQLAIAMNPPATPTITGLASVCAGTTGVIYSTQTGMSAYAWTVSAGGSITAGSGTSAITVTWSTVGAKTVTVNYNTPAGCSALTPTVYNVTVNALPVPAITGPNPACNNNPGLVYSTQAGMTGYTWNISAGGSITAGSGTSSITVTWTGTGAQSVSVNYINASGCTATSATVYP
ncbi:MAG: hypothetical protein NT167_13620, partial [Verrucomicrobia bacterium]|nr:hypothetical protein [Verrucomicrobiota bacterium]